MKNLIPISLALLILASCKKTKPQFNGIDCSDDCYILTGKIVDSPSNTPLSNVEVGIYYRPPGFTVFDPTVYIGNTLTNANGEYKFQFDGSRYPTNAGYYTLEADKDGYFNNPNDKKIGTFHLDSSQFNIPFKQDFALFRIAKLVVHFKATIPINSWLDFFYRYNHTEEGIVVGGPKTIDTTMTFITAGDIPTNIHWDIIGSAPNTQHYDTIIVAWKGSAYYEVVY